MSSALWRDYWALDHSKSPELLLLGKQSEKIIRLGRKGLKEAKKATPVRMSTTIGEAGKTQEEARVGFSVEWAVKVIRKAESWLCPCRRMGGGQAQSGGALCLGLFWTLRLQNGDKQVSLGNRQMLLDVRKPGGKAIGRQICHRFQGERGNFGASASLAAPGLTPDASLLLLCGFNSVTWARTTCERFWQTFYLKKNSGFLVHSFIDPSFLTSCP